MGWGACCGQVQTRGLWSQTERLLHINCLEFLAGGFALKSFFKKQVRYSCAIADGQHIGHQLHKQNGGLNFTSLIQPRLRPLAMVPRKINHSHGTAFTRVSKCHCRLRIPGKSRFQRLATGSISASTTEQEMGALRNRSVCNKTDCTTAKICELETRSSGGGSGYFHTGLEPIHSVCIPSICTNRALSTADTATVSLKNNHSDTSLGNPTLVSTITRNDHRYSSAPPSIPRVTETRGQATPPRSPAVSRMACLRTTFQGASISQPAQKLLLAAWRSRTKKTYSSAWGKWTSWCGEQQVNPLSAPLESILNFLTTHIDLGREYRTLNVYRSAISATHPRIQGFNVGQHPLVVQLLKGIYNSRPPMPRYVNIWDVEKVTQYLASLGPNEQLTLKQLSKKLVVLLALSSAERGSELVAHDLRYRRFHPEGVSFNLPELTKGVRVGKPLKTSFHASFPLNELLCPCLCLKEYEKRTKPFRPSSETESNKLFLSVNRPHKPIASGTLSH